jgi:hypothetical protein
MGNYTEIKVLANLTDETLTVTNKEKDKGVTKTVAAWSVEVVNGLVVPWAENKGDYDNGRKLVVSTRVAKAGSIDQRWFWERSGAVYFSTTDEWSASATKEVECCYWYAMTVTYKGNSKTEYEVTLTQIR